MTASTKIDFNFETGKFEHITVDQVKFWEEAYPDVDVIHQLTLSMPAWLDANTLRAKKNYKRFIVNWLASQQERYAQFNRRKYGNDRRD